MFKFNETFVSLFSAFTGIRLKVKIIYAIQEIFLTARSPAKTKSNFNKSVSISFRVKDLANTSHDTDISHSTRNNNTNTDW
jgi:hypothetical protein